MNDEIEERFINITHLSEICITKQTAYSMLADLVRFLVVKKFAIIQRYSTSFISCNLNHVPLEKSIELANSIIYSTDTRYQISKWIEIRDALERIKLLNLKYKGLIPNTSDVFIEHRIGKNGKYISVKDKKDKNKNDFVIKFNEIYGDKK